MADDRAPIWMGLPLAVALVAGALAPLNGKALPSASGPAEAMVSSASASSVIPRPSDAVAAAESAKPAAAITAAPVTVDSSAQASDHAQYHDELMAAAASLKADIQAESDASAAAVTDTQAGPTSMGMIVASGVVAFAVLVAVIVIPASLRARRRRREIVADMLRGKPPHKR